MFWNLQRLLRSTRAFTSVLNCWRHYDPNRGRWVTCYQFLTWSRSNTYWIEDLSPMDFCVFPDIKVHLRGHRYESAFKLMVKKRVSSPHLMCIDTLIQRRNGLTGSVSLYQHVVTTSRSETFTLRKMCKHVCVVSSFVDTCSVPFTFNNYIRYI